MVTSIVKSNITWHCTLIQEMNGKFSGKGRSVKYDKSPKWYVKYRMCCLIVVGFGFFAIRWRLGRIEMHVVYAANVKGRESLLATQPTFSQIKEVNQGPNNTFPCIRLYDGRHLSNQHVLSLFLKATLKTWMYAFTYIYIHFFYTSSHQIWIFSSAIKA